VFWRGSSRASRRDSCVPSTQVLVRPVRDPMPRARGPSPSGLEYAWAEGPQWVVAPHSTAEAPLGTACQTVEVLRMVEGIPSMVEVDDAAAEEEFVPLRLLEVDLLLLLQAVPYS
jgi:hypothetical protein